MRTFRKFGIAAVLAFCVFGAAQASASTFTASATGSLSGEATTTQTFTTDAGQIKCTTVEVTGTISSVATESQTETLTFKNCTAFGFVSVDFPPLQFQVTSNGTAHITNTVTIVVTGAACHKTYASQTSLGTVTFTNVAGGKTIAHYNLTGITYTGTGGVCGTFGTNGTYSGSQQIGRVGGGSVSRDP